MHELSIGEEILHLINDNLDQLGYRQSRAGGSPSNINSLDTRLRRHDGIVQGSLIMQPLRNGTGETLMLSGTGRKQIIMRMHLNNSMKKKLWCLAQSAIMAFPVLACTPLFTSNTDDRIESAVRQSYVFRTYLKEDDITIRVGNGVATLTGTVFDESHKFLAGDIVASLPGITAVENRLNQKGEIPAANTDEWLVTKVKSTLSYHRNVDAAGTEVIARDGAVILRGKAGSIAQKDLTTEYVKDIEGVQNIQNEMTVSSAELLPGEKPSHRPVNVKVEAIDDASITVMIEMMLLNHQSTGSLTPIVLTKDGIVRLRGDARNAEKKELVGRYAGDVHGVQRVINHMSFE